VPPISPPASVRESAGPGRRVFLALDLPAETRALLAACREAVPGARWVAPEQLHLTVRFLGKVAEAELDGLRSALAAVRAPAFELDLAGVGVFPAKGGGPGVPPRVLWAGIAPAAPVRALKRAIDAALGPDPEAAGRDFSPHVTLARWKETRDPDLAACLAGFIDRRRGLSGAPFPVRSFRLYQSRTLPEGPEYRALADFPLGP
jgi:RNA 2',3'-cyclic 3'-phosphodiesterase